VEAQSSYLTPQQLRRLLQMIRLHRDLGLNWVGAAMVLDMAQEIARLRAQLHYYRGG